MPKSLSTPGTSNVLKKAVAKKKAAAPVKVAAKKKAATPIAAKKPAAKKVAAKKIINLSPIVEDDEVVVENSTPQYVAEPFEPVNVKRVVFTRPAVQEMVNDTVHICPHNYALIQPRLVRLGQRCIAAWLGYAKEKLAENDYTESMIGEVIHVNGSIKLQPGDIVVSHYPMPLQTYVTAPVDRLVKVDGISGNYLTSPQAYVNYVADTTRAVFESTCSAPWRKLLIIGSTAAAYLLVEKLPNAVHYEARKFSLLQDSFDIVFDCRPVPDVANAARFVNPGGLYVSVATGRTNAEIIDEDSISKHGDEDGIQVNTYTPTQSTAKYMEYWLKSLGQSNPLLASFTSKGKLSNVVTPLGDPKMNVVLDMVN